MKISEMTNDQATECLIRISAPFGAICEDDEILTVLDEYNKMKNQPFIKAVGKLIPKLVACALVKHKEDLYEIVGALTFKPIEAVAKDNFVQTVKVFRDSYDEVLKDFFTSSVEQAKKTE